LGSISFRRLTRVAFDTAEHSFLAETLGALIILQSLSGKLIP